MLDPNFVILGAAIGFIGGISYLVDTLKGKTKPNKVTWFFWSLAPLIAFAGELDKGVGLQSLMTFMVGFSPLLIFLASASVIAPTLELPAIEQTAKEAEEKDNSEGIVMRQQLTPTTAEALCSQAATLTLTGLISSLLLSLFSATSKSRSSASISFQPPRS